MLGKIKSLLREPPFTILQTSLKNIPFRPFRIELIYLLCFQGKPAILASSLRGPGIARWATADDVPDMIQCRNIDADYAQRFQDEEHCIVALAEEDIVGFEWFCTRPLPVKRPYGYKLTVPPDAVYAYDAFLLPEYRMKGFWLKFKSALSDAMNAWGKNRIIAYVDYGNWVSLKTHLRFGFRITKRVLIVQLFGWPLTIEMSPRLPRGFAASPGSMALGQGP